MEKTRNYMLRVLAGDSILIPRGKMAEKMNGTMTLSDTAAFIYEKADTSDSFEELLTQMSAEYQTAPESIRADVLETLSFMTAYGILEESDREKKW